MQTNVPSSSRTPGTREGCPRTLWLPASTPRTPSARAGPTPLSPCSPPAGRLGCRAGDTPAQTAAHHFQPDLFLGKHRGSGSLTRTPAQFQLHYPSQLQAAGLACSGSWPQAVWGELARVLGQRTAGGRHEGAALCVEDKCGSSTVRVILASFSPLSF